MPIPRVQLTRVVIHPRVEAGSVMPITAETAPLVLSQAAKGQFSVIEDELCRVHSVEIPEHSTVLQFLTVATVAAVNIHAEANSILLSGEPTDMTLIVNRAYLSSGKYIQYDFRVAYPDISYTGGIFSPEHNNQRFVGFPRFIKAGEFPYIRGKRLTAWNFFNPRWGSTLTPIGHRTIAYIAQELST